MKAGTKKRKARSRTEEIRHVALLSAAMQAICLANQLRLSQHRIMIQRPPHAATELDFRRGVAFGLAFTEGNEATFCVPAGHRFVIEYLYVSSQTVGDGMEVQMTTRSPHMFRQINLPCNRWAAMDAEAPLLVPGSTDNTLLFRNGGAHSSSTVPDGSYVQLWGCLAPTDEALSS